MENAQFALKLTRSGFIFNVEDGRLELVRIEPSLFELDLILIDSLLPQILAAMLIKAYNSETYNFTTLAHWLEISNPLGFNQSLGHKFYEYKLKLFLMKVTEYASPYSYNANYLVKHAKLVLLSKMFTPVSNVLSITMGITICNYLRQKHAQR